MYKEYHYTQSYKCYYFADEHERLRDMHTMRHHSDMVIIGTMIIVRQHVL